MVHSAKVSRPLVRRLAAFLAIFVGFSGIMGPRLIGSAVFYSDGFGLYGSVGKALLFAAIAFALLVYRAGAMPPQLLVKALTPESSDALPRLSIPVRLPRWRRWNGLWLVASVIAFDGSWLAVGKLLAGERSAALLATAHGLLWLSVAFALVGCFGWRALGELAKAYRRHLLVAGAAGAGFYLLLLLIYHLWAPLSATVLYAVAGLLRLSGLHVAVVPPRTLLLSKFGITIAQACSGIESLALFSGLYALVGFLDAPRFNKRRLFLTFPLALLGLFVCNILRVYALVLAGYYIDPKLAFSLFHTYAGMIFFICYSFVFWTVAYHWLTSKPAPKS